MKTLKLKTIHRLLILEVLNTEGKSGGSLSEINRILKFIDRVDFSSDERALLSFRSVDGKLAWNVKKDGKDDGEEVDVEREIEISDEQVDMLKSLFEKRDKEKKFVVTEANPFFEIASQIGYKFE
jgi:hypothetical protein